MNTHLLSVLAAVLLLPALASAQTNPCASPIADLAINPTVVYVELENFAGVIPGTTTPLWNVVEIGDFLEGVNPATGGAPVSTTTIQRETFMLVSGACYVAPTPHLVSNPTAARYSAARTKRDGDPTAVSAWSTLSNPFVRLGVLTPIKALRRGR